jgi:DNA-binding CsgD family transcriptional regulator
MALTLSCSDVTAFTTLERALLSPLEHADVDSWCRAVLPLAEALFHGDRSAILVPLLEHLHYVSGTIAPEGLAAFRRGVARAQPQASGFSDPAQDWAGGAATMDAKRTCHEAAKRPRIVYGPVATTALPTGEAFLGVAWSEPGLDRFGEAGSLELMGMVLPAFKAGVQMLVCADQRRRALAWTLDALGASLLVCDAAGAELHRSKRMTDILRPDPERESVVAQMHALAASLVCRRAFGTYDPATPVGAFDVRTAAAQYHLRGSYPDAALCGTEDAILVTLEKPAPELPSAEQLAERHGLTPREAEVTALLARGLSNREIANRLTLSPFTVRHHVEWVFSKLGVHSRKALGLTLMGQNDASTAG